MSFEIPEPVASMCNPLTLARMRAERAQDRMVDNYDAKIQGMKDERDEWLTLIDRISRYGRLALDTDYLDESIRLKWICAGAEIELAYEIEYDHEYSGRYTGSWSILRLLLHLDTGAVLALDIDGDDLPGNLGDELLVKLDEPKKRRRAYKL